MGGRGRFGFRRTLPHVLGTALGIGLIAAAVAAGLGALVLAVPAVAIADPHPFAFSR